MRHLRLFSIFLLLSFAITGCRHHQPVEVAPPPQAEAPIVTTLPPMPPLTFPDVQLAKPEPVAPPVQAAAPPEPPKPPVRHVHHRRKRRRAAAESGAGAPSSSTPAGQPGAAPASRRSGTSLLGQLSTDDATSNPNQHLQTERLIRRTQLRLARLPHAQQVRHADTVAQIKAFLDQAKQALSINDAAGAKTLAIKARILLDELRR